MVTTPNLGLKLTENTDDPFFEEWQPRIDGAGTGENTSNFKKIDEFAGAIYGKSGTLTIAPGAWTDAAYTAAVPQLGADDAIFLSPATREDQTNANAARLFATADAGSVTIQAENTPTSTITFKYFISRGKA